MIIDQSLVFDGTYSVATGAWVGHAVFSNGSSVASANVIDLLNARDLGQGRQGAPLAVNLTVTTAFLGGTSLNVQLQGSTDSVTWTTYAESGAVATASLTIGAKVLGLSVPASPSFAALPRYWQLNYVCAGNMSQGSVIAMVATQDQVASRAYPSGFVVNN